MSRFFYAGSITTTSGIAECQQAIQSAFLLVKKQPFINHDGSYFQATLGNQFLFRFLGAFFASDSMYPMIVKISLTQENDQRIIDIQVHEDFGFGTLWGVETKYREKVEKMKNILEGYMRTQLGMNA